MPDLDNLSALLQSVDYFLDTTRMATSTYFWHFLDIIRSKIGQPLLNGLAALPQKFVALLTAEPNSNAQVLLSML